MNEPAASASPTRCPPERGAQTVAVGHHHHRVLLKLPGPSTPDTPRQQQQQQQQPPPPLPAPIIITSMLFCASLQNRPAWAAAVPVLLASRAEPRWQEARLGSHDLAVRLQVSANGRSHIAPVALSPQVSPPPASPPSDVFRFVLIAPADVGQSETTRRLQRLSQRRSGLGRAVVFLLQSMGGSAGGGGGGGNNGRASMAAYQQLQIDLLGMDLPVLPLTSVQMLPAMLAAFCSQIASGQPPQTDHDTARQVEL